MEKLKPKKHDYSKDKRGWLYLESGGKIKLRKYISEVAKEITKANDSPYELNREYIIKAYNNGGLKIVQAWIKNEFEIIKNSK
jgi:hypothetical protein